MCDSEMFDYTAVGPIREMGSIIMRGVIVLLFHMDILLCD